MCEVPCITYMALYILSFHILHSNSKTSTLWKLNAEDGKIVAASQFPRVVTTHDSFSADPDQIFHIISSTVYHGRSWTKTQMEYYCTNCRSLDFRVDGKHYSKALDGTGNQSAILPPDWNNKNIADEDTATTPNDDGDNLDCGKPVNFTFYDNLVGVANRHTHPHVPEPQATTLFRSGDTIKKNSKNSDADVNTLEKKLMKAKKEKPKSIQLYNEIGNFWRIKGDTEKSIECFRRALAVSPQNAEVLLNLARVLFHLQYLDDAIYLARRSLELHPPDKNAWKQYFTLGEIFKVYGHYQEAVLHLRHALELKPEFEPALLALREMETVPDSTIHIYTAIIIACLALGVLLVLVSSSDNSAESEFTEIKTQRHFNRAMAMRSLKMGISARTLRAKRYGGSGGSCG